MSKGKQTLAILLALTLLCSCGDASAPSAPTDSEPGTEGAASESRPGDSSEPADAPPAVESVRVPLQLACKNIGETNPISTNLFFADPTSVEYDGRLYVYGTCDTQQYKYNDGKGDNGYGQISSLSCFSTDDMKNWTYHGDIDVRAVCKWAVCSWAPSIVSRVTDSGETEFLAHHQLV